MIPVAEEAPERVLPRIYLHFMAFTALLGGFVYGLAVLDRWHHLDDAPILFGVAWVPPLCVEFFRRLKVERLIWPAMLVAAILGYRFVDASSSC